MNRRSDRQWLKDIEAAGADLRGLATGLDEAGFAALPMADRRSFRALKHALSEIGEAVKALELWHGIRAWIGAAGQLCAISWHIDIFGSTWRGYT